VFQPVLTLHECADPAVAKSTGEPLHFVADFAAAEPLHYVANSAIEPLQSVTNSAASGATPTETS
jgi:hypothetical protein